MMRLAVNHVTVYAFDMPMRFVTQSHRLTPASSAAQTVLDWTVSAPGAVFGAGFVDGAGDRVTTMTVDGPVERIEITVEGIVETTDTSGVLRGLREMISPRVYLQATKATQVNGALVDLHAASLRKLEGRDALARAHRLCEAVAGAIAYTPGATHAQTTAAEAVAQGTGVCQDHAHTLIALAHLDGVPARYVTGYLLAREDGAAEDASHAWAELHVEGLGWVGFDPANACCPDPRYIRLGTGRDAAAAAPIRGVSRGGGAEAMEARVSVSVQE
jgi:transglutaminase-like putative cysteine protease